MFKQIPYFFGLSLLIAASFFLTNNTLSADLSPAAADNVAADAQATATTALAWLNLLDHGQYVDSWNAGALTFQLTISQSEWNKAMEKLRKPLGDLTSRKLLEQRIAENPKGLPAGEYMVLYYQTAFSNRPNANELITMQKQQDGNWKVLTYHVR
jgi:Protein of unknown function (DUF4019)